MPIIVPCPACGAQLKAPASKAGKKAQCTKCGDKFRIPGPDAARVGALDPVPPGLEVADRPDETPAEILSLDDDDTPAPPTERFNKRAATGVLGATRPNGAPAERDSNYVRPGERKSGGVTLVAGLLGAVALAALVVAVIIHQNRKQPAEAESPLSPKLQELADSPFGVPAQVPPQNGQQPVKEVADTKKIDRKRATSGPPAVLAALSPATRTIQLRTPSAKPEYTQNGTGEPFSIEAPFEKIRKVFPQDNRLAQDTVVVWQSNGGVAGLGEQLTVDSYSGQTGKRIKRLEFDGDGKEPRCDLSPDGKFFAAASAAGSITMWNLADASKTLHGFDPYADKPDHKKAGLAAVFFTSEPGHLVTVSTAGAVHLFKFSDRKQLGEFIPAHGLHGRIVWGKNIAVDEARSSVVLAVGGVIYQVATTAPLPVAWQLETGEVGRSFGIAAVGVPGRIGYAFETAKKERGILFCMPKGAPIIYRWPEEAGEPAGIHWSGTNMAVVATTRGAVWVESAEMTFLPVALAEVAGGKSLHRATESFHWYLMPHPDDKARCVLLALSLPPQDFLDFRNAARAREPLITVRLDEKGLWK